MTTAQQERLTDWVKAAHEGQHIRRSGEPYFNHVWAVAEMAAPFAAFGFEVGLCHDLLEKTNIDTNLLLHSLISFRYTEAEATSITKQVTELTNLFKTVNHPKLSGRERKDEEDKRLLTISTDAQTVKYCDLLYNIDWMMAYDRDKAAPYLKRKLALIKGMNKGDSSLRLKAIEKIESCLNLIVISPD